ncbi:MAG: hypothetical protein R2911_34330 [Caldilineaceae bacterium]
MAADKNQSSRYLTNVLALRTGLWLAAMPLLALVVYGYSIIGNLVPTSKALAVRKSRPLRCWRRPCSLPTGPTP